MKTTEQLMKEREEIREQIKANFDSLRKLAEQLSVNSDKLIWNVREDFDTAIQQGNRIMCEDAQMNLEKVTGDRFMYDAIRNVTRLM